MPKSPQRLRMPDPSDHPGPRRGSAVGALVRRIEAFVQRHGGAWNEWVVGVAADPERALARTHRVEPEVTPSLWVACDSPIAARAVVRYFHEAGCLGRPHWDDRAFAVYVYRRAAGTWP